MITIENIIQAIDKAQQLQSKIISSPAYNVPALASLRIRCLLNNLGELAENYLEVGVHVGGSFCSSVNNNLNLKNIYAIDSWESDHMGGNVHEADFNKNAFEYGSPVASFYIIKSDCFKVNLNDIKEPIDFYLFDAGHSYEEQKNALLYYKPILADTFIYCCDDWQYGDVKKGTLDGIKEGEYEILFEQELLNDEPYNQEEHRNDQWWRGYAVFILKKK